MKSIAIAVSLALTVTMPVHAADPSNGACNGVEGDLAALCRSAYRTSNKVEELEALLASTQDPSPQLERRLLKEEETLADISQRYEASTGQPVPGLIPVCELPEYSDWLAIAQGKLQGGVNAGIISNTVTVTEESANSCTVSFLFSEDHLAEKFCALAPNFTFIYSGEISRDSTYTEGVPFVGGLQICRRNIGPFVQGYDPVDLKNCGLAAGCQSF